MVPGKASGWPVGLCVQSYGCKKLEACEIAEIAVIARDRRDRKNQIPAMSAIPAIFM
jgi:hypothetical protein